MVILDSPPYANWAGFLATLLYVITLLPTILRIVFPSTRETGIPKALLLQRRMVGIFAFLLAIVHGYLMIVKRELDFFDPQTYWVYIQGIWTFLIFVVLAFTSNDWSVKKLKKNWKKLHQLTYLAMFLLVWHIIDKMWGHWTWLTPASLLLTGTITLLFLIRILREWHSSEARAKQVSDTSPVEKKMVKNR